MISTKISDFVRLPVSLLVALVLAVSMSLSTLAADTKMSKDDFNKKIDTRLSMQFVKMKSDRKLKEKNRELAIYKVLDVQKSSGEIVPMPDDQVELAVKVGDKGAKSTGNGLPWASLKSDGMILMQLPKDFMRKRAKSSAKTFWRIDNSDNQFAFIKP